jgi:hypothetical protein
MKRFVALAAGRNPLLRPGPGRNAPLHQSLRRSRGPAEGPAGSAERPGRSRRCPERRDRRPEPGDERRCERPLGGDDQAHGAGGPYTLSVSDGRSRTAQRRHGRRGLVLLGSVEHGPQAEDATNGGNEVRDSENPLLRFADVGRDVAPRPLEEAKSRQRLGLGDAGEHRPRLGRLLLHGQGAAAAFRRGGRLHHRRPGAAPRPRPGSARPGCGLSRPMTTRLSAWTSTPGSAGRRSAAGALFRRLVDSPRAGREGQGQVGHAAASTTPAGRHPPDKGLGADRRSRGR